MTSFSPPIAITGATGFIGSAAARRLSAAGYRLRVLVRPESVHKAADDLSAERILGDLEDAASLRRLLDGAAAVVHCAGVVRGAGPADFDHVNAFGAARLVREAAGQRPRPRFLWISSLAAREPALSPYAASKRRGEALLAAESAGMPWTIVRPPAVYGPGDREIRPLFEWMQRGIAPVIGPVDSRLSLLYVSDLADAILRIIEQEAAPRRIYELHDGRPGGYSWQEIIDAVEGLGSRPILRVRIPAAVLTAAAAANLAFARLWRRPPMLTPGKVRELCHPDWVCDNGPLSADTGWRPRIDLGEGLRRTLGPARATAVRRHHTVRRHHNRTPFKR